MYDDTDELDPAKATIVARCANEGVPTGAIARILQQPFETVSAALKHAHATGAISTLPRSDWPPGQTSIARLPTSFRTLNSDDLEFGCKMHFKVTNLEAAFMTVLLRFPCAEKDRLHAVIEEQRSGRPFRPDRMEQTDPKMVDVIICHMRKKLRSAGLGDVILTSHGRGYYIDPSMKELIYQTIGVPHYDGRTGAQDAGERASVSAASA